MLSRISLLAAAMLLAGCESGSQSNQQPAPTGTQPADATTTPVQPARLAETTRSQPAGKTVPSGELDIVIQDTGVTITANAVSQQSILYRLATQAGFGITEAGVPWEVVTLAIEADSLHAALVELLKQHPYQIIYEFDNHIQADTLKRVVVGDLPAGRERIQSAPAWDAEDTAGTPDYKMTRGGSFAISSVDEQVYLNLLLDPSPDVREEAAEDIEPTGIALDYLARMVIADPSPEVRMAVALTLGDSEDPTALDALMMALQDDDPRVLEEVIGALGDIGNRSTIPYLQPFLDHPDEDVRDAAESSIDDLN